MSNSESGTSPPTEKRKRGVRNPTEYKQSRIKEAKVRGEEHLNHVNKTVEARKTGNICGLVNNRSL